jgi:hypothetical protein
MFSSLAEGFIQKFCGRYLKNFNSDNISIGITGTITIKNVQIKTEELVNFHLPYRPALIFIGNVYLDLPFVSGGNFDVRVSDVLIVGEKIGDNVVDFILHRSLQMWIAAFYFGIANSNVKIKQSVSSSEIEYIQKLIDRLCVTVENLHFRVEEVFTDHIPCPIDEEIICLGVIVKKVELRPPSSQELSEDSSAECVWNTVGDTRTTRIINKLYKCSGISVYCNREEGIGSTVDSQLSGEFVRKQSWHREKGRMLAETCFTAKMCGAYQRTNLVFGPVTLSIKIDKLDIKVTDEQLLFLSSILLAFDTHVSKLQLRCQLSLCTSAVEVSRRARMRWKVLKDVIRTDWWRYANTLNDGCIRWRVWYDIWRQCARYTAIREILLYHVGYEVNYSFIDDPTISSDNKEGVPNSQSQATYSMSENLVVDHHQSNRGNEALKELRYVYLNMYEHICICICIYV